MRIICHVYRILFIVCILSTSLASAQEIESQIREPSQENSRLFLSPFDYGKLSFFPMPIIDSFPDEGEIYGINPVFQWQNPETYENHLTINTFGLWNEYVGFSGALQGQYFPNPYKNQDHRIEVYFDMAQRHYREARLEYFHPRFQDGQYYVHALMEWQNTPFGRFFGFGPSTTDGNETVFESNQFHGDVAFGWYFLKNTRVTYMAEYTHIDINPNVLGQYQDTNTVYPNNNEVFGGTYLTHHISLTYDSRPNFYWSDEGRFLEATLLGSIPQFGSKTGFFGYELEGIQYVPLWKKKIVSVFRLHFQDLYGDQIPFWMQSSLGGMNDMRSFMPGRFRDRSRWLFTIEQRFTILDKKFFGMPVLVNVDPFLDLGQVFNNLDNAFEGPLQYAAGVGFRIRFPKNYVTRIDVSWGREGNTVYTAFEYPF